MERHDEPIMPLDLERQNLIDQLCDEFEDSWKRGQTPDITSFLGRVHPDLQPNLLAELVKVDIEYQPTLAATLTPEFYANRFPQFKHHLTAVQFIQPPEQQSLSSLTHVGKLKLVDKVGQGTFGVVWKAWDPDLERFVAVKLPTETSLSREYEAEFRHEAKAAAALDHACIVQVISFGTDNDFAYIVYEFVEGVTLHKWIRQNSVTPKQAALICSQVASALAHAHENHVVHRDLKPGNIMIDQNDLPRITDFGLAKRMDSVSTAVASGAIVGTLAYMSPEQAEGISEKIDARTDLYSLGVILFELLTKKPLFEGPPREVLQKILSDSPPKVSKQLDSIPLDLQTICLKCVAKERADRYQSAVELAADLTRFVNGEPILARPIPAYVVIWRWSKNHWQRLLTVTTIVMLLGVVIHGASKSDRSSRLPPPVNPSHWMVRIVTNPPGATVRITPVRSETGEFDYDSQIAPSDITPLALELPPSQYRVDVVLRSQPDRTHQVRRTVPPIGGSLPTGNGNARTFVVVADRALEWPTIEIPDEHINDRMVYVAGTDRFVVGDPPKEVKIDPFYVAPREFSYGDYLKLRPRSEWKVFGKSVKAYPPVNTMPERWDFADHWAEESGGRLLTELEFEYLAVQAEHAESDKSTVDDDDEQFDVAGGSFRDTIVGNHGTVYGILSGYSEWTSSQPNRTTIWNHLPLDVAADYRVIRGGSVATRPKEFHRDPRQRSVARYYELNSTVGFRVARSAVIQTQRSE